MEGQLVTAMIEIERLFIALLSRQIRCFRIASKKFIKIKELVMAKISKGIKKILVVV